MILKNSKKTMRSSRASLMKMTVTNVPDGHVCHMPLSDPEFLLVLTSEAERYDGAKSGYGIIITSAILYDLEIVFDLIAEYFSS
jgi:hypothetical protein